MNYLKGFIFFIISYAVTINAQTAVTTCDIYNQGNLQTHPNSQIGIFGNLTNDGDFNDISGTSEVGFYNPNTSLSISGSNTPEIDQLIVDVSNDLVLNVSTRVTNNIMFQDGRIITDRNTPNIALDLVNDSFPIGENNPKHVDGYTTYTGGLDYTFPIGDDMRLRTLSIENGASINTTKAAYFYENPQFPSTFSGFDRNIKDSNVGIVSPYEFWDLDGDITTQVTLTWDAFSNISQLVENNNLSQLNVIGWNKTTNRWENLGNTNVIGNSNQGEITSISFIPDNYEVITIAGIEKSPEEEVEDFIIYSAVSPNGDGKNDFFFIDGISKFPNNTVTIYNRWGIKVFDKRGYTEKPEDGFIGISNGRVTVKDNDLLPEGTYFYIIEYETSGGGEKSTAGYLYINR